MGLKKIIKKLSDREIDEYIGNIYLFSLMWTILINYIRGRIYRIFFFKAGRIYIGRKCNLRYLKKINCGTNIRIDEYCDIDALSKKGLTLGDNIKFGKRTIINCSGSLEKIGYGIKIGNNVFFGNDCFFGGAGGIEIGDNIVCGQNVRFHSENHNYDKLEILIMEQGVTRKGIKIGSNCWIGSGVVFLDGVIVGDGVVIGANTLVNKNIPSDTVAVGNPVKFIKKRGDLN